MLIAHIGEVFAVLCGVFWAVAVCLFKKSGETMAPISLNIFKSTVATGLFAITLWVAGQEFFIDAPASDYFVVMVSGLLGMALGDTLFFASLNRIGAGMWAIVDCLYSPSVIVVALLLLGERLTAFDLIGASLVVSAILVASLEPARMRVSREGLGRGVMMGIGCVLLVSFSAVIIKPVLSRSPLFWVIEMRMLAGTVGLVGLAMLSRRRRAIFRGVLPGRGWKWTVSATFLGTYVAIALWIAAMKYTLVSVAGILSQLSVVFLFLFARLFLKEPLTRRKVLGLVIAFVGGTLVIAF